MPDDSARTTAAFLQSPSGVYQALHLAEDELRSITADKWDDELWGVTEDAHASHSRPKLYFYFGEEDYWVADETRDQLIAARAMAGDMNPKTKPTMEIDQNNVPHGFCIREWSLF